jgi:hypothetical protein
MAQQIKYAMPNGLFFIEDISGGRPPDPFTDEKVQYTSSCISVACLHEIDGEAEIVLGPSEEVAPAYALAFDGSLDTPSKELVITDVPGNHLLKARVPDIVTRIRVWRSHPDWPDQVTVGWG